MSNQADQSNLEERHSLLRRQLKRHFSGKVVSDLPEDVRAFIDSVEEAYHLFDTDRGMIERSLELSSQELLQTYSEMRAVFQAFPDIFFRVDSSGIILDTKIKNEKEIPFSLGQLRGARIQDIYGSNIGRKFQAAIDKIIGGFPLQRIEFDYQFNGKKQYYEGRLLPLTKAPTLEGQVIIIVRNITARKVAESRLEEYAFESSRSNKDLGDFSFIVSHNLQEIVKGIRTFVNSLSSRHAHNLDEEGKNLIGKTSRAVDQMQNLITDLLAYSKVSLCSRQLQNINLNTIVDETMVNLKDLIQNCAAQIQQAPLPVVEADPVLIRQLFWNVIVNALKFRRPDVPPVIKIYPAQNEPFKGMIKKDSSFCFFVVEDNGMGFDEKGLKGIFDMFHKLHREQDYSDTGIGLAVCRKIIERHGGWVRVESCLGEGSRFYFALPLKQMEKDSFV